MELSLSQSAVSIPRAYTMAENPPSCPSLSSPNSGALGGRDQNLGTPGRNGRAVDACTCRTTTWNLAAHSAGYPRGSLNQQQGHHGGGRPLSWEAEPASEEASRWLHSLTCHISSAPGTTTERYSH